MGHQEKLLEELSKRIKEWNRINDAICLLEGENGEILDDTKYFELCGGQQEVEYIIHKLLIDAKCIPLAGLNADVKKELDFFQITFPTIEEGETLSHPDNIRKAMQDHLDFNLCSSSEEFLKRLNKIKPLYLVIMLDKRVERFYRQAVNCYVYGYFESSCALCRAISEFILKEIINKAGCDHLLAGDKKHADKPSLMRIAKDEKLIPRKAEDIYFAIHNIANNILHASKEATHENCLESIQKLQEFIKLVYQCPDAEPEEV